jgi:hypothetical protein
VSVTLFGRATEIRKLPVRGNYDATAFDLKIADLQTWSCAVFGRSAGQARRMKPGTWVRITAEATDLQIDGKRIQGLKVTELLIATPPETHTIRAKSLRMGETLPGMKPWLEATDEEDVSWPIDGASLRLEEAAQTGSGLRELELTLLPVLFRQQGALREILAASLGAVRSLNGMDVQGVEPEIVTGGRAIQLDLLASA